MCYVDTDRLIIQSSAITMKTYRQLTTQMRAGNAFYLHITT